MASMKQRRQTLMYKKNDQLKKNLKAFSLLELMVVILILGLLAGLILPNITGKSEEAKRKLSCIQIKNIAETIKLFKVDNGRYPLTEEGLEALIANPDPENLSSYPDNPYLDNGKIPRDSWKNKYIYAFIDNKFEIISFGADGKEGGREGKQRYIIFNLQLKIIILRHLLYLKY